MAQGDLPFTIVGNLTSDPELRFTPSGVAVANVRVASTPRKYDSATGQYVDGDPVFMTCNIWRGQADNIAASLTKGTRVIATGVLKQRTYQAKDGTDRTVYELDVDDIGPSLKFAAATVDRNPPAGDTAPAPTSSPGGWGR